MINGRRNQLEGKIQERYGLVKDQVHKDIDDWYCAAMVMAAGGRALSCSVRKSDEIKAARLCCREVFVCGRDTACPRPHLSLS
jgi:hypothetical protein